MTAEQPAFLVVAVTARSLAQSAARGGLGVVALDCFADRDTVQAARAAAVVARPGHLEIDPGQVLRQAEALAPAAGCAGLVVGSGLEGRRGLLRRLAADRRLFGNSPAVMAAVKQPRRFFPLLDRLGVRHPDVSYGPPREPDGWLVKRGGGAGGVHVTPAGPGPRRPGTYFQRLEPGRVCSALFLADGRRAWVVGFNEQWVRRVGPSRPFVYAGAVGCLTLPAAIERDLRARLDALVAATGLVGLAGLDFIWRGDEWLALEVNPRPTATLDLYDADFPHGLFAAHLDACGGRLPAGVGPPSGAVRAQVIVAATEPWQVPDGFEFPAWCRDLPWPGQRFAPGDPVCTIQAEAADREAAVDLLRSREARLASAMSAVTADT